MATEKTLTIIILGFFAEKLVLNELSVVKFFYS